MTNLPPDIFLNASNILVQAGYTISNSPLAPVYSGALQTIVTAGLAVLAMIAAIGRAVHARQTNSSALKGIFVGTNTPKPVPVVEPTPDPRAPLSPIKTIVP